MRIEFEEHKFNDVSGIYAPGREVSKGALDGRVPQQVFQARRSHSHAELEVLLGLKGLSA